MPQAARQRVRRRARRRALAGLYEADVRGIDPVAALDEQDVVLGPADDFARELCRGVAAHGEDLDAWIAGQAEHWTMERMPPVDRAILRLTLFELRWRPDVPPGAAINEAVDLARAYSTADSGRFVNGLLGRLAERAARAPEPA